MICGTSAWAGNVVSGMALFGFGFQHMWFDWNWLCLIIIGAVVYIVYRIQRDDPEDYKK